MSGKRPVGLLRRDKATAESRQRGNEAGVHRGRPPTPPVIYDTAPKLCECRSACDDGEGSCEWCGKTVGRR
jgi:hypothetical protein